MSNEKSRETFFDGREFHSVEKPIPELGMGDSITPVISHEAQKAIEEYGKQHKQEVLQNAATISEEIEQKYYQEKCNAMGAPVREGHLDLAFFEQLKQVWSPDKEHVNWKNTYALRELALRGYEAKLDEKHGTEHVPPTAENISEAVRRLLNPDLPVIENNKVRYDKRENQ
jgi:hypothetical protein